MQVEVYECETVEKAEDCEQAQALAAQLGLHGPESFYGQPGGVRPYREMTAQEKFVYSTLLPEKTRLKDYDTGPVPLRVLQIAAHATELELGELYVWHQPGSRDPLLVAIEGPEYSPKKTFLLARWGDVLDEWGVLIEKARLFWLAKYRAEMEKARVEIDGWLAGLEAASHDIVQTGKHRSFSCHFF